MPSKPSADTKLANLSAAQQLSNQNTALSNQQQQYNKEIYQKESSKELIKNIENKGFGAANNIAIKQMSCQVKDSFTKILSNKERDLDPSVFKVKILSRINLIFVLIFVILKL